MKTGNQKPTFENIGDYAYSIGRDVVEMFAEDGGATFYPAQERELKLMLARNADGSPAGATIGISRPRQNGKSYAARYYAAYMGVFEHRDVLYSAHHSSTTKKMFTALCDLFDSPERYPDFAADIKHISRSRGYEGFYFKDWIDENGTPQKGGCIEFATRTNSGSRGGTYSVIIIDEAQEMTDDQQEAMLPTVSAAADVKDTARMPQQIYVGTPPGPTCNGTVFRKMHDDAHSGAASCWWLEWGMPQDVKLSDIDEQKKAVSMAYKTNPAMGYRIAEKTVINEFETMSADGFARERLGWWAPEAERHLDYAIPVETWDACASDEPKPDGKTAYGVRFSWDGAEVCLCGAVCPNNGPARVSLIERRPTGQGTQWLADWLNVRYTKACCVVIDGRNGVDVLIDKIAPVWRQKYSVIRPTYKDVIAAASVLTDALNSREVTWFKQQQALKDSATTAVKKPLAGGWIFGGDDSTPITAAALALWGAKKSKRDPNKKMRIG